MQILINIPDEQIKKSLEESKYIHEDEGEKGSVHIVMLYTNGQLDSVVVSRNMDFYSCEYKESLKAAYCKGYAVAKKEIAAEAQEREYKRGLNDAEKARVRLISAVSDGGLSKDEIIDIFDATDYEAVFENFTICEIIERIKEYDERKRQEVKKVCDDEIHVGDEVYSLDSKYKYIVLGFLDNGKIFVLSGRGLTGLFDPEQVHKTGRNYPIKEILRKLNESNESEE